MDVKVGRMKKFYHIFLKSEDNRSESIRQNTRYHAEGGLLTVSDCRYINELSKRFVEAGQEIGLRRNEDCNGEEQEGIGFLQFTQRKGVRWNTFKAFVRPFVHKRKNLTVLTKTHVTRVLFNERKEAIGVSILRNGEETQVMARNEVILSAGSVQSPQILLLSGIGPKEELKKHHIQQIVDLPVGLNLQDHVSIYVSGESSIPSMGTHIQTIPNYLNYLLFKNGPFASTSLESHAVISTGLRSDLNGRPDLQIFFSWWTRKCRKN